VIYLVPRNGRDRGLDTTGTLAISVGMFQQWLFQERSVTLREDLYQGTLDITFFRSQKTDAQIASFGRFVLNVLYAELKAAGFDRPEAKYLIYYDGSNPLTCGNALQDGPAAAVYLRGSRGGKSCGGSFVFRPGDPPGYWEFAMLHEVLHTLGGGT
jgi:hypothetical protein